MFILYFSLFLSKLVLQNAAKCGSSCLKEWTESPSHIGNRILLFYPSLFLQRAGAQAWPCVVDGVLFLRRCWARGWSVCLWQFILRPFLGEVQSESTSTFWFLSYLKSLALFYVFLTLCMMFSVWCFAT